MNVDGRTRDRVRFFFWAVMTIACVLAALFSRGQQTASLQRKAEAAQTRAVHYANVFGGHLDAERLSHPIFKSGYDELVLDARRQVLSDSRVARIRAWQPGGLLIFSSEDPSQEGVLKAGNDPGIVAAAKDSVTSRVATVLFGTDPTSKPVQTQLLSTYIPLTSPDGKVFGVLEIDQYYSALRDAASRPWFPLQVAFALISVMCLAMAGVAMWWSVSRARLASGVVDVAKARVPKALKRAVMDARKAEEAKAEANAETERLRSRIAELEQEAKRADRHAEVIALQAHIGNLERQAQAGEAERQQQHALVVAAEQQVSAAEQHAQAADARREVAEQALRETEEQLRALRQSLDESEARATAAEERIGTAEEAVGAADAARLQAEERATAESENARAAWERVNEGVAPVLRPAEPTVQLAAGAEEQVAKLEEALQRSEADRARLRAGRPETVYEVRSRELEQQLAEAERRANEATEVARDLQARAAGVDPSVIARLEERIAAAEARAQDAERRLDDRTGSKKVRAAVSNGDSGDAKTPPSDSTGEPEAPVDGSELRSKLSRATERRRRAPDAPTRPGPR